MKPTIYHYPRRANVYAPITLIAYAVAGFIILSAAAICICINR